ncbi:MAG: phosphomannomutase/phosphoglucomutase [Planctomycetota bacterium]
MSIFKAYDIRGKYPAELDEAKARVIGRAAAEFLKAKNIAVGQDVRTSSPSITRALISGLHQAQIVSGQAGASVTDIGVVTTPMSYFASGFYKFDATIMITASHNPAEYNGFKICRENAMALSEATGLKEIEKLTEGLSVTAVAGKTISHQSSEPDKKLDIRNDYKKHILSFCKLSHPLNIVVDTANGTVGPIFDYIFKDSPLKVTPLFFEPDGRFPNHEPNPMKDENLKTLKETVREIKADFGVAFDGDGDRCVFLDEQGERIASDFITALISRELLSEENGAAIVYDLRSSRLVREEVVKYGGQPIRERVGHAFIKETMRRQNAVFGGELSGHYYFRSNYFADSALIAFAHILNTVSKHDQPFSEIIKSSLGGRYYNSGELDFEVTEPDAKIAETAKLFSDGKQDWLDGLTVEYPDWWFNLRKSNTEPLLRLNVEAGAKEKLEEVKKKLITLLI